LGSFHHDRPHDSAGYAGLMFCGILLANSAKRAGFAGFAD